jgi:hypothetical protein
VTAVSSVNAATPTARLSRLQAGDHRAHVVIGGYTDDDRLAIRRKLGQVLEGMAFELLGELRRLVGGAVPHTIQEARAMQASSHVRTHGAESDETGLHAGEIPKNGINVRIRTLA